MKGGRGCIPDPLFLWVQADPQIALRSLAPYRMWRTAGRIS